MPKYLILGSYTAGGAKGVLQEGGTKRKQAAEAALRSVGAKIDALYFAFGDNDIVAIVDAPDHASMAAASMAISSSGGATCRTTVLMTPEELDQASKKNPAYRAPGQS
jgi:uncharacterized protein with GYD domain